MAELPRTFGPYLLLKPLGEGATGDVHLARPVRPRRGVPDTLVIKRLWPEHSGNNIFVQRFAHEAMLATRIKSPNVAKVYDAGAVDETLYLAIEYIAGWPLARIVSDVIDSGRQFSIEAVADIMEGALLGTQALHSATTRRDGRLASSIATSRRRTS